MWIRFQSRLLLGMSSWNLGSMVRKEVGVTPICPHLQAGFRPVTHFQLDILAKNSLAKNS